MTLTELIRFIDDELSVSNELAIANLTDKEIERIIKSEEKFFYMNSRDCVELEYAVMNPCCFYTTSFKKSRTIQLPECVWGVKEFREIKDGSRLFGVNDPNLNMEQIMGTDMWLSPFSSDVIAARTVNYSWFDLARSFTLLDIQHKFQMTTHRLQVEGRNPRCPVLIEAYIGIPEEDLFDYYYFQRWCIARCKCQLHRKLKTVSQNLIGGATITDSLWTEGTEEMKEIKEYMKETDPADWFLMVQ